MHFDTPAHGHWSTGVHLESVFLPGVATRRCRYRSIRGQRVTTQADLSSPQFIRFYKSHRPVSCISYSDSRFDIDALFFCEAFLLRCCVRPGHRPGLNLLYTERQRNPKQSSALRNPSRSIWFVRPEAIHSLPDKLARLTVARGIWIFFSSETMKIVIYFSDSFGDDHSVVESVASRFKSFRVRIPTSGKCPLCYNLSWIEALALCFGEQFKTSVPDVITALVVTILKDLRFALSVVY
ncbi:hypothetical protein EVAR_36658_1 [Eumeta japonica]|uniref:Uncharacterized protein n=1 Tax=Eumeta variegata TaxID=151549 RepID=A0A4C1XUH0_EUMVA|nr:hypothetical protein EVAR_36658_1 [Eumeta japonica]